MMLQDIQSLIQIACAIIFLTCVSDLVKLGAINVRARQTTLATATATAAVESCFIATGACYPLLHALNPDCGEGEDCLCLAYHSVALTIPACVACEINVNATFAAEIEKGWQNCQKVLPSASVTVHQFDACATGACNWAREIDSCQPSDTSCLCQVVEAAGQSEISACVNCEQSVDTTRALSYLSWASSCGVVSPRSKSITRLGGILTLQPSTSSASAASTPGTEKHSSAARVKIAGVAAFIIFLCCAIA